MNNEPAFPCVMEDNFGGTYPFKGMSLRDWFAGQALAGQCAYEGMEGCDAKLVAACAYEMADVMLKERAK